MQLHLFHSSCPFLGCLTGLLFFLCCTRLVCRFTFHTGSVCNVRCSPLTNLDGLLLSGLIRHRKREIPRRETGGVTFHLCDQGRFHCVRCFACHDSVSRRRFNSSEMFGRGKLQRYSSGGCLASGSGAVGFLSRLNDLSNVCESLAGALFTVPQLGNVSDFLPTFLKVDALLFARFLHYARQLELDGFTLLLKLFASLQFEPSRPYFTGIGARYLQVRKLVWKFLTYFVDELLATFGYNFAFD